MPTAGWEGARGAPRSGIADALATLGGALLLALALLASLVFGGNVFARYVVQSPLLTRPEYSELFNSVFGWGFAAAALLALPATAAAPFRRTGDPPLRARSALALVPGGLLALVILAAATVAVAALSGDGLGRGIEITAQTLDSMLTGFVFLYIPVAIMLAAALGGARTPEATAAAAAPVVLTGLAAMSAELAIGHVLLAVLLPLLVAAIVIAILYALAPARTVTPWLIGIALAIGMAFPVSIGVATPTEAMGLIALFGIPIALVVRVLALRQPMGAILRQAATESASVILIVAASAMASFAYQLAIRAPVPEIGATPALLIGGAAAFLAASYFVTSLLVLGLAIPFILPVLRPSGIDQTQTVAILVLLCLAAVAARAARRDSAAPAQSLPPAAAFIAAATFVVLAAVIAFVPGIALGPVRAMN